MKATHYFTISVMVRRSYLREEWIGTRQGVGSRSDVQFSLPNKPFIARIHSRPRSTSILVSSSLIFAGTS